MYPEEANFQPVFYFLCEQLSEKGGNTDKIQKIMRGVSVCAAESVIAGLQENNPIETLVNAQIVKKPQKTQLIRSDCHTKNQGVPNDNVIFFTSY